MKFPTFSKSKTATPTGVDQAATATPIQDSSKTSSLFDAGINGSEKVSRSLSRGSKTSNLHGEKTVKTTPVEEAAALEKLNDEIVYPSGAKLAIITTALCLSVFCMALVRRRAWCPTPGGPYAELHLG